MTTLIALSVLVSNPPAWTKFVDFSTAVKADRDAYAQLENASGEVILFNQDVVEVNVERQGTLVSEDKVKFAIHRLTREAEPTNSAWLMGVGPVYTEPVRMPYAGRIGPRTLSNIVKFVDAMEAAQKPVEGGVAQVSAVNFRNGQDSVMFSAEAVVVSGDYFSFSFPRAIYPSLRSAWVKLSGVKTD